jgi:hypothetical protein
MSNILRYVKHKISSQIPWQENMFYVRQRGLTLGLLLPQLHEVICPLCWRNILGGSNAAPKLKTALLPQCTLNPVPGKEGSSEML